MSGNPTTAKTWAVENFPVTLLFASALTAWLVKSGSPFLGLRHTMALAAVVWCASWPVLADTAQFASRAAAAGDTKGQTFAVIDKAAATLSVYAPTGKLLATTPVLLGLAKGDENVPGIGTRPIADIAPHERTTPAGRFDSEPGMTLTGQTVVWIDYEAAVSIHRLRPSSPTEKRPDRLASKTPLDNRITYGCVNVPPDFYDRWVMPTLGQKRGVVYVLPEMQPDKKLFSFLR